MKKYSPKNKIGSSDVAGLLEILSRAYPDACCALHYHDPWQLLVAVILSAQCTDARVNMVTPALFRRFPTVDALSRAASSEVESMVRSTGFFRAKTKSILGAAKIIVDCFQGRVPSTMEEMLILPGVARKTANVVLGTAFGISSGIVVDTHVSRITQRLGLSRSTDAAKIEQDLMRIIPQTAWISFAHQVIFHGRRVCKARNPECSQCPLVQLCPFPPSRHSGSGPRVPAKPKPVR